MKKVLFITGTRADYGKLKPLIKSCEMSTFIDSHVFITGMHLNENYGYTANEILKSKHKNIFLNDKYKKNVLPELGLAELIQSLSDFIDKLAVDALVIHGDRPDALAGAIVGSFKNILVIHIEGGELSGSIDESIRHAVSKLSHVHFVANNDCKLNLMSMGEAAERINIIGSPEFDILFGENLQSLEVIKKKYNILFDNYGIFIFHSVTTEVDIIKEKAIKVIEGVISSKKNFIIIYPNNDPGSNIILKYLEKNIVNDVINVFYKIFKSIDFEDFIVLLKGSQCIVGNSSCGVRQAPAIGIPSINIGSRQKNRNKRKTIFNVSYNKTEITNNIIKIWDHTKLDLEKDTKFGNGESGSKFIEILESDAIWSISLQK